MDKLKFLSFAFTAFVLLSLASVSGKPLVDDCQDHDMVDCARIRGTPVCREVWVYEYCPVSCGVCGMEIPGGNEQHTCKDKDSECDTIQGDEHESCKDVVVRENCPKTCGLCGHHHPKITHPPHLLKTTHNLNINITTTSPPELSSIASSQSSSQRSSTSQDLAPASSSPDLAPSSSGSFEATLSPSTPSALFPSRYSSLTSAQLPSQTLSSSRILLSSSYGIVAATSIGQLPSYSLSSSLQIQVGSVDLVQTSSQQASRSESLSPSISSKEHNQIFETVSTSDAKIYETAKETTSSESTQQSSYRPGGQHTVYESSTTVVTSSSSPPVNLVSDYSKLQSKSRFIQASSSSEYVVSSLVQMNQESSFQLQHSYLVGGEISSYQLNSDQTSVPSTQQTSSAAQYMQSQPNILLSFRETITSSLAESQMIRSTAAVTDSQSSSYAIDGHDSMNLVPSRSVFAQHMPSKLISSVAPTVRSSKAVNPFSSQSTESSLGVDVVTQLTHGGSSPAIVTSTPINLVMDHSDIQTKSSSIQSSLQLLQQTSSDAEYMQSHSNTLQSSKDVLGSSWQFQTKMENRPSETSTVSSEYRQSQMIYATAAITDSQSSNYAIDGHSALNQMPTSSVFALQVSPGPTNSIAPTIKSSVAIHPSSSQSTESSKEVNVVTTKVSPEMTSARTDTGVSYFLTDESTSTTSTTTDVPDTTPTVAIQVTNGVSCRVCEDPFCTLGFESIVKCPDTSPYCMNTIQFDSNGKKTLTKRCAKIQECHQNMIEQSSRNTKCLQYNDDIFYTDLKCNFCCVSDACNIYNVPKTDTRYGSN